LGEVVAGARTVLDTIQSSYSFSNDPLAIQVAVSGSNVTVRTSYYAEGSPPSFSEIVSREFPASDPLNVATTPAGLFVTAKVGLLATAGTSVAFDAVSLTETDRWYRFTTLGDGRVGDQIKLLTSDGTDAATSRPRDRELYVSRDDQAAFWYPGQTVRPLLEPGRSTGALSVYANGSGPYTVSPANDYAVSSTVATLFTLDLTSLLGYVETPELIESASLSLFNRGYTGPTFANGSITLSAFDDEPNRTLVAADVLQGTAGPYAFSVTKPISTDTAFFYEGKYFFGDVGTDLTSVVRQALTRGRTRIGFKLTATGVPADIQYRFARTATGDAVYDPNNGFVIQVAARNGVLADVYDAKGRQYAAGKAIVDMRDFPAGDYFVRVYDAIRGSNLPYVNYWSASEQVSARPTPLRFVVQVRQVHECQVGDGFLEHGGGRFGDPGGARQTRHRAPEGGEGERPEFLLQLLAQAVGGAGDVERLVAVHRVPRLRRHAEIDHRPLVEPPEQLGTAEVAALLNRHEAGGLVDRFRAHEAVALLPEADFVGVVEKPAVRHHAVSVRLLAGEQCGLGSAGDRRQHLRHVGHPAGFGEGGQPRCVGEQPRRQTDGVNEHNGGRHEGVVRFSPELVPITTTG
jgi:hypothetical protein